MLEINEKWKFSAKKIIKKNQVEISALKHTITKLKKQPTMNRLNSRMERTGSRISELEDIEQ